MTSTDSAPSGGQERLRTADPGETASRMAGDAGQTIKQEAASFAAAAQDTVAREAGEQKETAAKAIGDFAAAIRRAGEELGERDQTMAAHLVRQAADGLGDLAHMISDKRPDELLDAMRDFGRSNPVAFAAGSVLAGFAIGRLVRSGASGSDEPSPEARSSGGPEWTGVGADGTGSTRASAMPVSRPAGPADTDYLASREVDMPVDGRDGPGSDGMEG